MVLPEPKPLLLFILQIDIKPVIPTKNFAESWTAVQRFHPQVEIPLLYQCFA